MKQQTILKCYFTVEELKYVHLLMVRERYLTNFVNEQLKELEPLGIKLPEIDQPNMVGKLMSYIKRGNDENM